MLVGNEDSQKYYEKVHGKCVYIPASEGREKGLSEPAG